MIFLVRLCRLDYSTSYSYVKNSIVNTPHRNDLEYKIMKFSIACAQGPLGDEKPSHSFHC